LVPEKERVAVPPEGDSDAARHKQRKEAPARIAAATPIDATMIKFKRYGFPESASVLLSGSLLLE
jgi:hypothetical protein